MRRAIRTRRLSIAAIVSLLAAVAVGTVEARSFWNYDEWHDGKGQEFDLMDGCAWFSSDPTPGYRLGHEHGTSKPDSSTISQGIWGFGISPDMPLDSDMTKFVLPLWPLVLLLLIAPVGWLRAPPPNAPAFPVVITQAYVNKAIPTKLDQKPTPKWLEAIPWWCFLLVCILTLVMICIGLRWLVALTV